MRVNERIRIPQIRLIGPDGAQLGVYQTFEALKMAREFGLDLVEISPTARPPVCKIMDSGKYKYELSKREHEARKRQVIQRTKEVQMRPNTGEHDVQVKVKHIRRFLEEGDRVKVTVKFRGREITHRELGHALLEKVLNGLADLGASVERPRMEGYFLNMMLAPKKK